MSAFWKILTLLGAAIFAYVALIRTHINRWGVTTDELHLSLPGDDYITRPSTQSTRAITVNAPAEQVWQWVLQIGQGRGGFYSYDSLENLFGLNIHSANQIIPELQTLKLGDQIQLSADGPFLKVVEFKPQQALVLRTFNPQTARFPNPESFYYYDMTWAFILQPLNSQTTRFIIRGRGAANMFGLRLFNLLLEPITFIMEEKMLRGVKLRAEKQSRKIQIA